ncbi:hypothetical protein LTR62_001672 [Meristemomyces frigidus]|uniref:Uncharacterized protein n=1 Tax=Meristemomyces frigidus TaxID=1508187 RepID=A0AAN7TAT5_9PEZI|nr:hypothetical protein LTR62_001672 [Meristemomyces frigidus]
MAGCETIVPSSSDDGVTGLSIAGVGLAGYDPLVAVLVYDACLVETWTGIDVGEEVVLELYPAAELADGEVLWERIVELEEVEELLLDVGSVEDVRDVTGELEVELPLLLLDETVELEVEVAAEGAVLDRDVVDKLEDSELLLLDGVGNGGAMDGEKVEVLAVLAVLDGDEPDELEELELLLPEGSGNGGAMDGEKVEVEGIEEEAEPPGAETLLGTELEDRLDVDDEVVELLITYG